MQRRQFLRTSVILAAPAAYGCAEADSAADNAQAVFDAEVFPQSVASGDPRPNSVVLWTRVVDTDTRAQRTLQLELATDKEFTQRVPLDQQATLTAERRWDYCVRAKVRGLEPATTYYYRFIYEREGQLYRTRVGRTRTAPKPSANVSQRFAVMSCQDFGGRYFHAHRRLAELDLDFVVHLGDYIYETVGNPEFQVSGGERQLQFSDTSSALALPAGAEPPSYYAARSLDNYRDLYRGVRSDRDLQRVHERFPMLCTWDDHEFANDAYGESVEDDATGQDAADAERRSNADQAWFEYMPIDYAQDDFEFDAEAPLYERLRIYRDFQFGQHLHLVMTDLRRYRSDHLVPQDALPGRVAVTQERLLALYEEVPTLAEPYVNVDELALTSDLLAAAEQGFDLGFDQAELTGQLHVGFVNQLIARYNEFSPDTPLTELALDDPEYERGIAYLQLGKTTVSSSFGAHYFVEPEAFALLAADRFEASAGESEQVLGAEQEQWFLEALNGSSATWKVWGNAYTLSRRSIDLSTLLASSSPFSRKFQLSADDWDGFPNRRQQLLNALEGVDNLVAVTGDSHSFFVSTPGLTQGARVVEFVCGAMTSSTYQEILQSGGNLPMEASVLAPLAGPLIQNANAHIAYQNVSDNGFGVVEVEAGALHVHFHQLAHELLASSTLEGELESHFNVTTFRVLNGSSQIEQAQTTGYKRWDESTKKWV